MAQSLLSGLRVVELASGLGAAYCGKLLADAGADVTAVEPPGGSPLRALGPFVRDLPGPARGLPYLYTSPGKRAVTLDLADAGDCARFLELLKDADALIEDAPPGDLAALGIDDGAVAAVRPRLVWTSLTPFGSSGPYSAALATSLTLQALSGWLSLSGEPEREPVQTGGRLAELAPGLTAAFATLAALLDDEPDADPAPRRMDLSTLELMTTWHPPYELASSYRGGVAIVRTGNRHPTTHPFTILPCDHGQAFIGVITLAYLQWDMLCHMMGLEQFIDDPALHESAGRVANAERIDAAMQPWLNARSAVECFETAQTWRIPFALVPDVAAAVALPQHTERGFFEPRSDPEAGDYRAPGSPFRFAGRG